MTQNRNHQLKTAVLAYPLLFVLAIWVVFWVENRFNLNFNYLGIYPSTLLGLRGILFGPFIHGSLEHIFNNSVPLFVLSFALFYFYYDIRWKVLLYGLLVTGFCTWLIGRPATHIGASGVVYMLVAFLFFKGIFSKNYQLTALSLIVVFLYGSLLWYVFPINPEISWEGHLSGFFVGFVFALIFRKNPVEEVKYSWQREDYDPTVDPFLQQFDDDGNFIEKPKPKSEPETGENLNPKLPFKIVYTFKKTEKDKE